MSFGAEVGNVYLVWFMTDVILESDLTVNHDETNDSVDAKRSILINKPRGTGVGPSQISTLLAGDGRIGRLVKVQAQYRNGLFVIRVQARACQAGQIVVVW